MIYVLEDDPGIREIVVYCIEKTVGECAGFATPAEFEAALSRKLPELVLLDIMLPGKDGVTVLGELRSRADTGKIPVIMMTAKGSEYDKVMALERGADDYITKPFGMLELSARVKAVLRRCADEKENSGNTEYSLGKLFVSVKSRALTVDGLPVVITGKEFDLLSCLLANRGRVMTRDALLQRVWGYTFNGESRTVDMHVKTLRRKLGAAGELIETVRGVGYKIS